MIVLIEADSPWGSTTHDGHFDPEAKWIGAWLSAKSIVGSIPIRAA
jgi:hypothetical protein